MAKEETRLNDSLHWYKDALIYELHIKAFRDSNGDGIGDFKGLLEKLDYLQELGVTAIWLLPFYPSPLKDDGYDIADYYSIHTSYGNIAQFRQFLLEAHRRQLKVITELVINHTSDQHPWFQRARNAPKDSAERNYYVWTDDPEKYKDVRIIFQDYESSNWTWDPVAQQYYWHRFFHHQPDLNYDNPLVREEIFRILDFWCGMGVDGFRLDAIPYLFEREGTNGENLPETHAFLKALRKRVDEKYPGTVLLAEANMWPEDSASYFGDGDECHMNFHFPVMPRMFMSLQMEDQYPITDIFAQTPAIPETCQWAIFLRNHDELTLEMVTDEERDYMYKVYAKDPKAKINLGIRHRLAPLMENNRRKIELMNSLLFSLPGTPVIYYGDEIGMGDNFYLGDRDGVRTPMQWSPDRNAGFSDTNPQKLYLPVILDPEYHYETVNVETQRSNTSSLFWYMKTMISVRKKYKAFSRGNLKFITQENPKVLVFTRTYRDETVLVVVNFSKFSQAAEIDLAEYGGYTPVEVISRNKFPTIKQQVPYFFTLSPHSFHWFMLEPVKEPVRLDSKPSLTLGEFAALTESRNIEELESRILRGYVPDTKWFDASGRTVYAVKVLEHQPIPWSETPALLLLIEISYDRGLPEIYQLPLAFVTGESAHALIESCPEALVAEVLVEKQAGWLFDAYYLQPFQRDLGRELLNSGEAKDDQKQIRFTTISGFKEKFKGDAERKTKLVISNPAVTSIAFGGELLLKIYRKLDKGPNPDIEMTRYLSENLRLDIAPSYCGVMEWPLENFVLQLGMMETITEEHTDGYSFMLDRFNNYVERILATGNRDIFVNELEGTLSNPVGFDRLPENLQTLIGERTAGAARAFGLTTAKLHVSLSTATDADFKPEDFSLHYQRSLFSSMQTLTRETIYNIEKHLGLMTDRTREDARKVIAFKEELLERSKQIYTKKLDMLKIRIHGNLQLSKLSMNGNELVIHDFLGNNAVSYSERRLKRSALHDIAGIVRSFHNVAYEGLMVNRLLQREDQERYSAVARCWAHYVSGFFMGAYLNEVRNSKMLPDNRTDLVVAIEFFLLRKAMRDLNHELKHRPDWAVVPLRLLSGLLSRSSATSNVKRES